MPQPTFVEFSKAFGQDLQKLFGRTSSKPPALVNRPPVGINPNIPVPIQRELRKVANYAFDAQDVANQARAGLDTKVGKNQEDLLHVSQYVSQQVQADGAYPINLTGLAGASVIAAGTYTVGAKLTGGGQNGTITVNAQGQIVAIQQAT